MTLIHLYFSTREIEAQNYILWTYSIIPDFWMDAYGPLQPDYGRLPTLLTHAFLHGNWLHLGMNAFALLAFGAILGRRWGSFGALGLFLLTAIAGGLAYIGWVIFTGGEGRVFLVGASGGISGLMAASFLIDPRKPYGPRHSILSAGPLAIILAFIAIHIAIALLEVGMSGGLIAWQAHLGGFALGLVLFLVFDPFLRPQNRSGR